ncbi:MAG: DUF1456 family protein [Crocinitomicaceae bacterium]|nr:DUF1456 family protein [Crocinitomicaceae bacterium]
MNNNDILKRLRYTLDFNDTQMVELFQAAPAPITRVEVSNWLKKEEDEEFAELSNLMLDVFLNGLIELKRGKREGVEVVANEHLSNNDILKKVKIALNLKSTDIIAILAIKDRKISETELSAFLRNENHNHFKSFQDQYLRNFFSGLQQIVRPKENK